MRKPYLIGITGGSGSGKTTFINQLKEEFTEKELCVVSQDDYYRYKEEQEVDKNGVHNFDRPDSIDHASFVTDLHQLLKGEVVTREEYTFNNRDTIPELLTFRPTPVIIVEGIFIFHYTKIREALDLKVFLHAKENLKVIRRIKRDRVERNYPLDDVLYRYEHHVLPAFEQYIQPYMEDADLIINNNSDFNGGLEVLIGFVKDKLK